MKYLKFHAFFYISPLVVSLILAKLNSNQNFDRTLCIQQLTEFNYFDQGDVLNKRIDKDFFIAKLSNHLKFMKFSAEKPEEEHHERVKEEQEEEEIEEKNEENRIQSSKKRRKKRWERFSSGEVA